MRGCEYCFMFSAVRYNDSRYREYWSAVSKAVEQILQCTLVSRVSFEQVYSIVYKSVCDGFSERMYTDLLGQCSRYLEHVDYTLYIYKQECDERQVSIKFRTSSNSRIYLYVGTLVIALAFPKY